MLTICSVLWGDKYPAGYVHLLQEALEVHAPEHRFVCVTDQNLKGVECLGPIETWPGWWQKLTLFAPGFLPGDDFLFFDLDVMIIGSVSAFSSRGDVVVCRDTFNKSNPCNSTVMAWRKGHAEDLYTQFKASRISDYKGDQDWIADRRKGRLQYFDDHLVASYKADCSGGDIPRLARVISFHGYPKPHMVPWTPHCTAQL